MHHHGQKPLPWRHWLKWVVAVDLDQQFVLSQLARRGPWNDCANLPPVVEAASQQTRIGLVLADAEFDSERNHTYIRKRLGAQSVIPAKRGKKTWRVHGVRAEMRRAFPQRLYRRRSLIESLFSSVKRNLSARAPGRSLRAQMRQALLLGLSLDRKSTRLNSSHVEISYAVVCLKKKKKIITPARTKPHNRLMWLGAPANLVPNTLKPREHTHNTCLLRAPGATL